MSKKKPPVGFPTPGKFIFELPTGMGMADDLTDVILLRHTDCSHNLGTLRRYIATGRQELAAARATRRNHREGRRR